MNGPVSRRPPWAKDMMNYKAMIEQRSPLGASKPGVDHGPYHTLLDEEKIAAWQVSKKIPTDSLPSDLQKTVNNWTLAGAALDAGLERMQDLMEQADQRAFPTYSHEHLLASHLQLDQDSTNEGASQMSTTASFDSGYETETTAKSSPPKLDTTVKSTTNGKANRQPHPNQLPDSITSKPGMESPPFTPISRSGSDADCASGARSPANPITNGKAPAMTPDFIKLSAQLSPLRSPSQYSFTSDVAKVDHLSWGNYMNACAAELHDLQKALLPRLRGCGFEIDRLLCDLKEHPPKGVTMDTAQAVYDFAMWWAKEGKVKVAKVEGTVQALALPKVEDVM